MKNPLVSVLICSYNAERFVEATIRSVVNQTYPNMEILVLDNNSSDKTVDVLRRAAGEDPRLRIYEATENLGAYGGLNYLLDQATGDYIAIQDHDDLWREEKIEKQVSFLERHGYYLGCGTAIVNWYEQNGFFLLRRQRDVSTVAWHTSFLFRRSDKRYRTSITVGTDFDFMKNVLCEGKKRIANLTEAYVLRRIWAGHENLSTKWAGDISVRRALRLPLGRLDRFALVARSVLHRKLFSFLLFRVVYRRNLLRPNDRLIQGFDTEKKA